MVGMPTLVTILRMSRLKFLQNIIKHIEHHTLVASVLFGRFVFEDKAVSNPWVEQFYDDVMQCEEYDGMSELCVFFKRNMMRNKVYV